MRRSASSERTSARTNRSCGPRSQRLVLPRRLQSRASRATAAGRHMQVGSHSALHPAPAGPAQRAIGDHFDGEDRRHRLLLANRHGPAAAESAVVSTFFRAKPSLVAGRSRRRIQVSLAKPATAKTMRCGFRAASVEKHEFSARQVTQLKRGSMDHRKPLPMLSSTLPGGVCRLGGGLETTFTSEGSRRT